MVDLELFDIREYLDDRSIPYIEEGKNVSADWIGVNCPFCTDPSHHLGIHMKTKVYSCFRCGEKGNVLSLIKLWDNTNYKNAISTVYSFHNYDSQVEDKTYEQASNCMFPPETCPMTKRQKEYLKERNFNPNLLIEKYKLKGTMPVGAFKYRIMIPYFLNGEIVTYSARTTSKKIEPKYRHASIRKSVVPVKKTIYNIDSLDKRGVIVEGCTDVWRIGDGACSTSGTQFTEEQVNMILQKNLEQVFVLFDKDAKEQAERLAYKLSSFTGVEIIDLDSGDPADMTDDEVNHLKRELKL